MGLRAQPGAGGQGGHGGLRAGLGAARRLLGGRHPAYAELLLGRGARGGQVAGPWRAPARPRRDPACHACRRVWDAALFLGLEARRRGRLHHPPRDRLQPRWRARRLPGLARVLRAQRFPHLGRRASVGAQLRPLDARRQRPAVARPGPAHRAGLHRGLADDLDRRVGVRTGQLGRAGLLLPAGLRLLPVPDRDRHIPPLAWRRPPGPALGEGRAGRDAWTGRLGSRARPAPGGRTGAVAPGTVPQAAGPGSRANALVPDGSAPVLVGGRPGTPQ